MNSVYGRLALADQIDDNTLRSDYDAKADDAVAAHSGIAVAPGETGYDDYVNAVGQTFWMSLTANELVDILVSVLDDKL